MTTTSRMYVACVYWIGTDGNEALVFDTLANAEMFIRNNPKLDAWVIETAVHGVTMAVLTR